MNVPVRTTPGVISGVNSQSLPPGALKQAANLILRRPDLLEPRRSIGQLSETAYPPMTAGTSITSIFGHQRTGKLWALTSDGKTYRRTAGSWGASITTLSGFDPTNLLSGYLRAAEMNGNLYFASPEVYRITGDTATPTRAGLERGPELILTASGSGALLTTGQSVAYRWTWGFKDANSNVVVGEPGGWSLFTAAGTTNVIVKAYLGPSSSGYFFQLWRTATFASGITPDDEMQLVFQGTPTSTDVANGYISFIDAQPDNLRGAALYTNSGQGGATKANLRPPPCSDIAAFRGAMFYAGFAFGSSFSTVSSYRGTFAMLGIPTVYSLTGAGAQVQAATPGAGQATYTFTSTTTYDFTGIDNTMKLAVQGCTNAGNNGNFAVVSVDSANRKIVVTNGGAVNEAAPPAAAQAVCAALGTSAGGGVTKFHAAWAEDIANKLWAVTATGTVAQQIDATARSICRVTLGNGATAVAYVSGPSDAPGLIEFRSSDSRFTVQGYGTPNAGTATAGPGTQFSTKWAPDISAAQTLTADGDLSDLAWSKYQQPEHVPATNRLRIGTFGKVASRILPLRDSLLVFKSEGGLYRVTGDGTTFIATPVDLTLQLLNSQLACLLHNEAYAVTNRGILKISDAGLVPISNGVSNLIQPLLEPGGPLLWSVHCEASETDSVVYFYFRYQLSGGGPITTLQLIYNAKTQAWTGCNKGTLATIATVDPSPLARPAISLGGTLYRHATQVDVRDVFSENFTRGDEPPAAKQTENGMPLPGDIYNVLCSAWNFATLAFTVGTAQNGSHTIAVGDVIRQFSTYWSYWKVTAVNGSVLTLARYLADASFPADPGFVNSGVYQLLAPPTQVVQYNGLTLDQPAAPKTFERFAAVLEENATADTIAFGFTTEVDSVSEGSTSAAPFTQTVETDVPADKRRCNRLNPTITHADPVKYLVLEGYSVVVADEPPGQNLS